MHRSILTVIFGSFTVMLVLASFSAFASGGPGRPIVIPDLYNTGANEQKNALPAFALDSHYQLRLPGGRTSPLQTMIYPGVENNRLGRWLIPACALPPQKAAGDYVWSTRFTMPADADPQGAVLTGRWAADSVGRDILVNGTSSGQTAAGASAWSDFKLNGPFRSGQNTLQFLVHNSGTGPDALRVEFTDASAPAASSSTLKPMAGNPQTALLTALPSTQTVVAGSPATVYVQYQAGSNLDYPWQYTVGVLWPGGDTFQETSSGSLKDTHVYTAAGNNTVQVGLEAQATVNNQLYQQSANTSVQVTVVADASQLPPMPTVYFSSATYSAAENAGQATITVNLSAASQQQVVVGYSTSAGTAVSGTNYLDASGILIFNAGDTSKTFTVQVLDDNINAPDTAVNLKLSQPANAALANPSTAVLTIQDSDPPPILGFSSDNCSVNENSLSITIAVTLDAVSGYPVTVTYSTADGTAKAGTNYTAVVNQQLTFNPGTISQNVTIPILND